MSSGEVKRKLVAILAADVVGYSRLMAADEEATIQRLNSYREEITALLTTHNGRLVDFTGDNFLAEFPSALDGMRCAVEIQRALSARNSALPEHCRMEFRIGLHLGDVRIEADRIYGDGVNISSRLEGLAEPGGICISSNVYDLVQGKLRLDYRDLGEQQVKNIPRSVRAYRVATDASSGLGEPPAQSRRAKRVALGIALAIFAFTSLMIWRSVGRDPSKPGSKTELALAEDRSIAVLPFANISRDPDQEYFSDGLTEDIITSLSKFEDLFVIARHSTFHYKDKAMDVRDIGRELGVRYVLEGSVRRVGDRVRVTAQLSDAGDGRQLWADTYDRDLTASDLFGIQDELTQQVVGAIAGSYGAISRPGLALARRKTTENLDAYDCVLRTYEYLQTHTAANHLAARNCLERAVHLDADYPDAWAWLAYTYAEEHRHRWNARPESYDALERAHEVAESAVRLDQTNQVAHGVLALTYFGLKDFDRFRLEAEKAIALNPNNAVWLGILGTYLVQLGEWEQGLPKVKKALALNPHPPDWLYIPLFLDHYRNSRYEAALTAAQKITTEDSYRTNAFLAATYGQLGRHAEARRAIDKLLALTPDFPERFREDFREQYGYPDDLTSLLMEGLRKAGLEFPTSTQ